MNNEIRCRVQAADRLACVVMTVVGLHDRDSGCSFGGRARLPSHMNAMTKADDAPYAAMFGVKPSQERSAERSPRKKIERLVVNTLHLGAPDLRG